MAINPNIALSVKGIELQDPLAQYGRVAAIQSAQQQNQLAQLQMQQAQREQESTNALNRAYAAAYNPQTGEIDANALRKNLATGGFGSKLPALEKSLGELAQQRLTREKLKGEITAQPIKLAADEVKLLDDKLKQTRQFLETIDPNDPNAAEAYMQWHRANHADPIIGKALEARGITVDQSMQRIQQLMQTPGGLARLINESKLGTDEFMKQNKPVTFAQDTGSGGRLMSRPGLGGAATVVPGSEFTKSRTFADITAERNAQTSAGNLALAQQKFAFEQANPGYELQQTEDGSFVGVNKRTLQAVPVTMGGMAPAAPAAAPSAPGAGMPGPRVPAPAATPGVPVKGAPKSKDISVSEQQASYNIARVLNAADEIGKITKKDPNALAPGMGEALAKSVGLEGTANVARSTNRQIVNGAQRDALDALLYLATGAAYNKEQLQGAFEAYIPSYTDDKGTREAKQVRMTNLIKDAKVRAGKAWTPKMDAAMQSLTGSSAPAAAANIPAPSGVDPSLWNVMTPEERKLWPK